MVQSLRPRWTPAQKTELWRRWRRGESLNAIGRALGRIAALVHESGVRFRKGRSDWMDEVESPSHLQEEVPCSELGLL